MVENRSLPLLPFPSIPSLFTLMAPKPLMGLQLDLLSMKLTLAKLSFNLIHSKSYKLPPYATVFQAEVEAINKIKLRSVSYFHLRSSEKSYFNKEKEKETDRNNILCAKRSKRRPHSSQSILCRLLYRKHIFESNKISHP